MRVRIFSTRRKHNARATPAQTPKMMTRKKKRSTMMRTIKKSRTKRMRSRLSRIASCSSNLA